jgi:hypothetical protein
MPLHSLLKEIAGFEQCEVEAVLATFDAAAERLNLSQRDNALRKLLAGTVIQCFRSGERDLERLCTMVLVAVEKGLHQPKIASVENKVPTRVGSRVPASGRRKRELPCLTTNRS